MTGSLTDKVVLITRPREEAGELATLLQERGARPLVAPAIERFPVTEGALDQAVRDLIAGRFAWAVFTSEAGVEAVLTRLGRPESPGEGLQERRQSDVSPLPG